MGGDAVDAGLEGLDWSQVDKIDVSLANLSSSAARVELDGLANRVASEKKKLKSLVTKHGQAVDEIARVRREIASERDRMFEEHSRLENELGNASARNDEYSSGDTAQLEAELAQVRKKIESKRANHDEYLDTQLTALRKRERQVLVQTRTVTNLFHRKLALGQRAYKLNDTSQSSHSTNVSTKTHRGTKQQEEEEDFRVESEASRKKSVKKSSSSSLPRPAICQRSRKV